MADVESENFPRMYVWIALSIFACVFIQIIAYFISKLSKKQESETPEEIAESEETKPVINAAVKSEAKAGKPSKKRAWKGGKSEFSHPWLLKGLKGHTGAILDMDFSSNGKFLATSCEDRSVILWDIKDLTQKEHKSVRINIDFDHASFISWSPDGKAFIIHRAFENCIEVYKLEKKKDGMVSSASKVMTFEKMHTEDVIGFDIASNGKFMMSCSAKTDMIIWDLRGQQLARIDTYLMSTMRAKITPCSRFVVATGFAPDVKVMEVCFTRTGEFKNVSKAFELTGHTSGIYDVAFDADTSHIATVSKDGTWKLYHTKIEYEKGETPHVITTGSYTQASHASLIALSPNAEVVVIATIGNLEFFDASNGKLYDTVEDICSYPITCLKFDSTGKYLFVCGDRAVRVFHNVAGYATSIDTCQRLLKTNPSSATKERLQKTIEDSRQFLQKFDKN